MKLGCRIDTCNDQILLSAVIDNDIDGNGILGECEPPTWLLTRQTTRARLLDRRQSAVIHY